MGDVHEGEPLAFPQVREQVQHAEPDRDVEHGHRLIGQQHPGPDGQRPGDGDPLPLTAGQLVRVLADVLRAERHALEQARYLVVQAVAVWAGPVDPQRPGQVIADGVHQVE